MKQLESLKGDKFKLSDAELLQVRGGYGPTGSSTYTQYETGTSVGSTVCDEKQTDSCVDW